MQDAIMAITITNIFSFTFTGITSPYPSVVIVITAQYNELT